MTNQIEDFKGKRMLERAEELDTFWAYTTEKLPEDKQLVLLDNVQFIYELALAQLELQSLGVRFEVTNGLENLGCWKHEMKKNLEKNWHISSL